MSTTTIRRHMLLIMLLILPLLLAGPTINTGYAQAAELRVGFGVNGALSSGDTQAWRLEASENMRLFIFVSRVVGDLDPMVTVLDADGTVIAENDDRQPDVIRDAGVSFVAVAETVYIVRVQAYAGNGLYRLWAVPGFAQIVMMEAFDERIARWSSSNVAVTNAALQLTNLQQANQIVVVTPDGTPPQGNTYLHTEFQWISRDAETRFGVAMRTQDGDNRISDGYYWSISPEGLWWFERQQFGLLETVASGTVEGFLPTERMSFGVVTRDDEMIAYLNGSAIAEISDDTYARGRWGLMFVANTPNQAVRVEEVLLTAPPSVLPEFPLELENWRSAQPADIANELAGAGIIADNGRRTYTVLDTGYQVSGLTTTTYLQTEPGLRFLNMLLSVDVQMTEGINLACGIAFRELSTADLSMAYADGNGGAGLLSMAGGVLRQHAYDFVEPPDSPLSDEFTRLTLIINDEYMTLYVNGRYFETHYVHPVEGNLSAALINYAPEVARCSFKNLWVWQ